MSESVSRWLQALELGEYAEAFNKGAIEWDVLPELDHEILKELGVGAPGHRLRILKAIRTMGEAPTLDTRNRTEDIGRAVQTPIGTAAERRQLTVMFCDMAGSTELSQRLDPEHMREVNRAFQDACKAAIERFDGYVARYMGDGILAYFGYPQAHEDDAERAIHAGLAIIEAASGLSTIIESQRVEIAVRLGIATGPVVVGDLIGEGASQESAVVGDTPNLAARLQGLASLNSVVVASGTHDLAAGQFAYQDLGEASLKGIAQPVRAWRVVSAAAVESRFQAGHRAGLTALVGRENEIALLLERWEQTKEGDGQIVALSGEAGIGKSRITEATRERTADDELVRIRYQCSPFHTNSALYPVIQHLERAARFDVEDSSEAKLQKLIALLAPGMSDTEIALPIFGSLLSIPLGSRYPSPQMSAEQRKAATLQALLQHLERLSGQRPVLLIFEDVHWADPTSLELLELIVERVQALPVMVIVTFRPEFSPAWTSFPHVTALTLNRFTRSLAAALVENISAGADLPVHVLEQIIEKTDGVPLFVEELTKTILEFGDRAGAAIPATLHDSLMARLDRLGAVKEVAQIAAVIGREFDFDLLANVSPLSFADLHDALDQLVDAELVFRRSRAQQQAFIFKHALVQDAAYESLLKSTRRELHQRIAEALEQRFPEIADSQPELLGHHYTQADLTKRAIEFWHRAAQRSVEQSGNAEAVAYFDKALLLLKKLPDTADRQKQELVLQTGIAEQFLNLAGMQTDQGPILMGHRVTGISLYMDGRPAEGLEHLTKVIELYDADQHAALRFKFGQDPCAAAMAFCALCHWQTGQLARAAAMLDRALEQARSVDHINTLAYVGMFGAANLHHVSGNLPALREVAASVRALAEEHGLGLWKNLVSIVEGWIAAHDGDRSGISHLRSGLDAARETFAYQLPYRLQLLAEAHLACGEHQAGLGIVEEAIELGRRVGDHSCEAENLRLKALLLMGSSRSGSEAETTLVESIRVAKGQRARTCELRSATALSRLWGNGGRRREAGELLAPICESFMEYCECAIRWRWTW